MATIRFERSEACAAANNLAPSDKTVDFDASEGPWVQLTRDTLRTQDGAVIAHLDPDDDCWYLLEAPGEPFSDVIIELGTEAAAATGADGFDAWVAADGGPATETVEGDEVLVEVHSVDPAALCLGEAVTECCGAAVTFHDETLCCKACWAEVGFSAEGVR